MDRLKPLEHRYKALVFRLFRNRLRRRARPNGPLDPRRMEHILFIRPEKIGDMVVSFPFFDALRRAHPHLKLSLLASPVCYPVVRNDPRFHRIYVYRKPLLQAQRVVREVRRQSFDCVVDLICDDSVTALFLSELCAPGRPRVGVGKRKYAEYYDFNYYRAQEEAVHVVRHTLDLLQAFGMDPDSADGYAPPYLDPDSVRLADEFIDSLAGGARPALIGYNLSAGKECRWWPQDKARALLARILEQYGDCRIVLFSTPADRRRAAALAESLDSRVVLIPDRLNIIQASAILRHMDILVTPDTSLVHIARSFRVPVVGLYPRFMRNYLLWRPYDQQGGAVVSPTTEIRDITVEPVFEAFQELARRHLAVST